MGHWSSTTEGSCWVRKQSRLSSKVRTSSQMSVHSCVTGTPVRKSEWITGNTSRDISLLSPMSKVSIPFLMPRSEVLNLSKTNKQMKHTKYIFIIRKEKGKLQ